MPAKAILRDFTHANTFAVLSESNKFFLVARKAVRRAEAETVTAPGSLNDIAINRQQLKDFGSVISNICIEITGKPSPTLVRKGKEA